MTAGSRPKMNLWGRLSRSRGRKKKEWDRQSWESNVLEGKTTEKLDKRA